MLLLVVASVCNKTVIDRYGSVRYSSELLNYQQDAMVLIRPFSARLYHLRQVTYHFLQSIMQHLHLTKGAPPTGQQSGGGAAGHLGSRTPMGAASYGGAPATGEH